MKTGLEDRKKLYAMIALAVIALALFLRMAFSGNTPTVAANAEPATVPNTRANQKAASAAQNLDPSLRTGALQSVESQEYKGSARNIFEYAQVQPPQFPKINHPPVPTGQGPNTPPPPPVYTPPPINLKFYGFANNPGEPTEVFLADGDDIFIAREGQIVNRHYKVIHIGKSSVEIEDVLNNNRQTIPLTSGGLS